MRITRSVAFWVCFVAQIRIQVSCRLLSTTNSKTVEFRFSEQNLNVLWSGFFRIVTTQNKNRFLWPETKMGRFVVRNFSGLWHFRTKTGRFVVRNFSGRSVELKVGELAPQTVLCYRTKLGRFVVRDFFGFVTSQNKNGVFCDQDFFGVVVSMICAFMTPAYPF